MAVTKAKKSEILTRLINDIKNAKSIWFAKTFTMTVSEFSELRNNLIETNSTYTVAKKTLIRIAVKEALNLDLDLDLLPGQVWMICSNNDSIAWLSKTNDFIKKVYNKKATEQKIDWVACIFEWQINGAEATKEITSMPSKETLLGRLAWSMQSPLSSLARFFDAAAKDMESKGKNKVGELESTKISE